MFVSDSSHEAYYSGSKLAKALHCEDTTDDASSPSRRSKSKHFLINRISRKNLVTLLGDYDSRKRVITCSAKGDQQLELDQSGRNR